MSNEESVVRVADGKYEVRHSNGTGLRALRHGEPWRDLTGDGLVLALVHRIEELEEAATLRQQAARVDEGMVERAVAAYRRTTHAMPQTQHDRMRAALEAALSAQPAERQGEAVAWQRRMVLDSGTIGRWRESDAEEVAHYRANPRGPDFTIEVRELFTHPAAPVGVPDDNSASVAAIQFALSGEDGLAFLRCWNEGNFDACRKEWPEAPAECYVGADPLAAAPSAQAVDEQAAFEAWLERNSPSGDAESVRKQWEARSDRAHLARNTVDVERVAALLDGNEGSCPSVLVREVKRCVASLEQFAGRAVENCDKQFMHLVVCEAHASLSFALAGSTSAASAPSGPEPEYYVRRLDGDYRLADPQPRTHRHD